jgi:hypothetical protein
VFHCSPTVLRLLPSNVVRSSGPTCCPPLVEVAPLTHRRSAAASCYPPLRRRSTRGRALRKWSTNGVSVFFSFSIISMFRWALTCDLASYAENSSLQLVAWGSDCATPNTPNWPVPMGWPSGGVGGTTQWQGHCRVAGRQWRAAPS